MALAPLAGLLLGVGALLVALLPLPGLLRGVLVVAALALGSRGMHLDGLADTADGLGSGRERETALEVMTRGDVGPFGVVALVLAIGAQASAAGAVLVRPGGPAALAVVVVASRTVIPLLCRGISAARPRGLGRLVAESVSGAAAAASLGLAVLLAAAVTWVWRAAEGTAYPLVQTAAAAAAGVVLALVFAAHCVRRFGGLTGDVLGAGVEVALTGCLVVLAG
jgi:adenosylcobinamide-GDP ribazoletransferase